MDNWKNFILSEFMEINPSIKLDDDKKYPFIEMSDLNPNRKYVTPSFKRNPTGLTKFEEGDTLFAKITPCLENGKIAQVSGLEGNSGCGSTEFIVFRGKKNISDNNFIYYLSKYSLFKNYAVKNMTGTAGHQRVPINIFNNFSLLLPEYEEQKDISTILSSVDYKIELLHQQNKTLELIAKAIFKHWFIDFEFPNEEGKPYKASGGKMINSELELIPSKFKIVHLKEIINLEYGKALISSNRENGSIPVFGSSGIIGFHNKYLIEGPGIIVGRAGIPGSVYWSQKNFYCVDSTFYVQTDRKFIFLLFYCLKMLKLDRLQSGSAVPGLNRNSVYPIHIILPSDDILIKFNIFINILFEKIEKNDLCIKKMSIVRNLLLQKLIKGEIRIKS
jgi:type I restriction enzyme, S subunit